MLSQLQADVAVSAATDGPVHGWWIDFGEGTSEGRDAVRGALLDLSCPVCLLDAPEGYRVGHGGSVHYAPTSPQANAMAIVGYAPAFPPGRLGDPTFLADHRLRYAYMTGAMANAIASVRLVEAVAGAGMLGCYGAAGRSLGEIESAVERLQRRLEGQPCCFNLIHSPAEPEHEQAVADLYVSHGVHTVEASAYIDLTLAPVQFRMHGIHRESSGRVVAPNRIIAKASRVEVAEKWFSPPPPKLLAELVGRGRITPAQAEMADVVPMAQDLTAEADSGGHTDNQSPLTLLPTMLALRDRMQREHRYESRLRVGAAGGIGTPAAAAAAFAMGAAYVVTGSINQGCVESGSSDPVRKLLADTRQADVMMAPAADMFELGVKLQVLKRGTLFAMRATRLYELYRAYDSLAALPARDRAFLEESIFGRALDEVWTETERFFEGRDPGQLERAERSDKHKMALVFRWYLGRSSEWANAGEASRRGDYQVWCGPAMGAFNEWVRGSALEAPQHRDVVIVALNILFGAAVTARVTHLRNQGAVLDTELARVEARAAWELAL